MLKASDLVTAKANLQELKQYEKKTGERVLWTNALFGGMPTYQINSIQSSNQLTYLDRGSRLFIRGPLGIFFAAMLIFYIMLVLMGVNPWLSIVGAIAFGLTTNNYVLYGAGHMTKVKAIVHLGLVTAGVVLAFRKKYLLGGGIFAVGMGLELLANHIQMTYYFFLTLIIYGIIELVQHIRKKEIVSFGKAVLFLGIGGLLALGSSTSKLWTTYEYAKDTMRGEPILELAEGATKTSSHTSGLDYVYATNWSNGFLDQVAGFIPGVVGKGGLTYWGANEQGTAGPAYYGAIVYLLFILGLLVVRGPVKWWLLGGVLLISLLSMGNHIDPFYKIMFDYFPLFNKFRTPNSALSVVAFLVPVLGFLGLNEVIKGNIPKDKLIKYLYISGGVLVSICLFFALVGSSIFDFSYVKDAGYAQQYNVNVLAVKKERASMMSSDSWRSFGFILIALALLWLYLKDKIGKAILIAGLGVFIIGDLWTINRDYLSKDNFVKANEYKNIFAPKPVDTKILQDKDASYRVFDLRRGLSGAVNSPDASYLHKNVGGYHPAKLQRYQDMLDYYILPEGQQLTGILQNAKSYAELDAQMGSLKVFNMLNTKYFLINDDSPVPNKEAMGNAWFVSSYKTVNSANEEINAIRTIDPNEVAVVHKEFSNDLSNLTIQKNGSIKLDTYQPDALTYTSNTNSEQLAVFSEVWYGPDKGWQAYVDGEPKDHIRVNYLLRGLVIPAGQHTIEFKFEPGSYYLGETISLICSLLIVLGLFGYIGNYFYQYSQKSEETPSPVKKTKVKATKSSSSKKKK